MLHIWPLYLFYFDSETISGFGGDDIKKVANFFEEKSAPRENPWLPPDSE